MIMIIIIIIIIIIILLLLLLFGNHSAYALEDVIIPILHQRSEP